MPAEAREDQVLTFLEEHGIPMPPKVIYRGLKIRHNITFGYRTVQNILRRLTDDGYVMRCDNDEMDAGNIVPVDDAGSRRAYYFITDKGKERIREQE